MVLATTAKMLKHDLAGLFLTVIISVFGTMAAMRSDTLGFETSQQTIAFERIAHLEQRLDQMQKTLLQQTMTIATLQAELAARPDPARALYAYLDSIESPAFLKLYHPETDEFRMLYINASYARVYEVTRALYIGRTDFEIHPAATANIYHSNDIKIIERKDFKEVVEPGIYSTPDGVAEGDVRFWKFYVKLPDGRELVAGMQIEGDVH